MYAFVHLALTQTRDYSTERERDTERDTERDRERQRERERGERGGGERESIVVIVISVARVI